MLFINLLPEDKRAIVRRNVILNLLISTLELFVILAIIVSSVFVAGRSVLENNFNRAVGQNALINKNFGSINQEIRTYNNQFKETYNLFQKSVNWSGFLYDVFSTIGSNLAIRDIAINTQQKKMTIVGFAANRDDLLLFLEQLKRNSYIAHADSPLSNLFSRNNIVFEINIDLNIKAIEQHYTLAH